MKSDFLLLTAAVGCNSHLSATSPPIYCGRPVFECYQLYGTQVKVLLIFPFSKYRSF